MLSIFLAEELERTAKDSQDVLFLQYFCDNKDEKRNTAVAIIRGLMFQLLLLRPKFIDHILPSFQIQKQSLFASPSFETLWTIFETILRDPTLGTVYCVLDGLDECHEASLEVLLRKLKALFSTEFGKSLAYHFNLIVVSRDLPEFIPKILSGFPRIRLDPDLNSNVNYDIHQFIDSKVDRLSTDKKYPKALRDHVKGVFLDRAKGTFLWVGIVAKELENYLAIEVERVLSYFPSGLGELYARMLLQIRDNRRDTAARILRWVVMAVRPLTISELSAAIGDRPSAFFSPDEVMRDQVSYCGYFLTLKDNDEVSLIHQSAKDYLLRETPDSNPELEAFRIQKESRNLEIARRCLHYLQNDALPAGGANLKTDISHSKAFPFLSYAVLHWPEHARTLAYSEDIFDLSLPFYHENSWIRESWLETYWAIAQRGRPPKSYTLLHLASYIDILPLAKSVLFNNVSTEKAQRLLYLNKKDNEEWTALTWAALKGHEPIVQLLLENGADIEVRSSAGNTALILAAQRGNSAIVELLLQKGADIEAKNNVGGTALFWVALQGDVALVHLLLEKGADIEARDILGIPVLIKVAMSGNEALVRLLLEKGADIEVKDKYGNSALLCAISQGHEALVQLLLENGADTEVRDSTGHTALIWAVRRGNSAIVELLLQKGADIKVKRSSGETVLLYATRIGNEAILRLLLKKMADVATANSHANVIK